MRRTGERARVFSSSLSSKPPKAAASLLETCREPIDFLPAMTLTGRRCHIS